MADLDAIFGQPLASDPAVALPPFPPIKPGKPGPQHKVQFVIEFVGPRSLTAQSASALLDKQWFAALGEPEIYAMAPSDTEWRTLAASGNGSFDSLALAWDMVSNRGELSSAAAAHLLRTAESFATGIQRRAMPLPPPPDVSRYVSALVELRDSLDIGVEIMLIPKGPDMPERDIWLTCAALGLDLAPSGFFEFRVPRFEDPVLSVSPMGGADAFSLAAVQSNRAHPGIMIGFNVPRSPDPAASLDRTFLASDYLCGRLNAVAFNDADQTLGPSAKNELKSNLLVAIRTLTGAGLDPGSRAALKLFA